MSQLQEVSTNFENQLKLCIQERDLAIKNLNDHVKRIRSELSSQLKLVTAEINLSKLNAEVISKEFHEEVKEIEKLLEFSKTLKVLALPVNKTVEELQMKLSGKLVKLEEHMKPVYSPTKQTEIGDAVKNLIGKFAIPEDPVVGMISLSTQLHVSSLRKKDHSSQPHYFSGLQWVIEAGIRNVQDEDTEYFSFSIVCRAPSIQDGKWFCEATTCRKLLNQKGLRNSCIAMGGTTEKFQSGSNSWSVKKFLKYTDLVNDENGFIDEGTISLQADIKIHKLKRPVTQGLKRKSLET